MEQHKSADHSLRLITILAWFPVFALLLPHGIVTRQALPVIGIVPMTFSACTGLVHLTGYAKIRAANIIIDLFCVCFLISILIPSWVFMAQEGRYYRSNGSTMLGAYGTSPMMMNFVLHTWFVLREFDWSPLSAVKTCPHCHDNLRCSNCQTQQYRDVGGAASPASGDSKESFASTRMNNEEEGRPSSSKDPRPSTDDETARLL